MLVPEANVGNKGFTVLIIERQGDIRRLLITALRPFCPCDGAVSSDEAIHLLTTYHYDLALVSADLAEHSLLDISRAIGGMSQQTGIILMPALEAKEPAVVAKRLSWIDYIEGPFDLYKIVSVVERAVKYGKVPTAGELNKAKVAG
jgi:two-component system, NtrC family, response regulator PilR